MMQNLQYVYQGVCIDLRLGFPTALSGPQNEGGLMTESPATGSPPRLVMR
jgi:hypothetical protein